MGNQIALLRKQRGFTQDELAEKLGITAQAISKWENGHTLPETTLLPLLANLLNSSIDSILAPNNTQKGDVISFGKYLWRVLKISGEQMLIITETTIGKAAYHDRAGDVTWEHCSLRKYLNKNFYNKFNETEKLRIIKTEITNQSNPWYDVGHSDSTSDNIFLLSYSEVVNYFGDSGTLQNKDGFCCDENGTFIPVEKSSICSELKYGDAIYDQYNEARKVKDSYGDDDWWWLRSPGGQGMHTSGSVGYLGEIWMCGDDACRVDGGIRPALWLSIK